MKIIKRLGLVSALWALFYCSAFAAGTVPGFALTPQFDKNGKIAPGCRLFTIQAGTVAAPEKSYQDSGLTLLNPNPLTCDATGRLPSFFLADGNIKLRLTDKNGVELFVQDNLLVIGASSGGGGGGSVDPTTILATGDFKDVYGTGNLTGFVRCNARTIGNATSGGTERANADTSALFVLLWNNDPTLAVSGGRGASAAADYAANKTITLPDCRGRGRAALSDMGNSDSGRVSTTYFGCTGLVLGCAGGSESQTLTVAQLAVHSHGITDPGHVHIETGSPAGGGSNHVFTPNNGTSGVTTNTLDSTASATTGITINNAGSGAPHANVQPTILVTTYIKL